MLSSKKVSAKILAITPKYFQNNGSGIAIVDEKTGQLEACGLLSASNQTELAHHAREFWEEKTGSSNEPKTLCIEYPQQCFSRTVILTGMLCAHIETQFVPQVPIRAQPKTWKRSESEEQTKKTTMESLSSLSKAVLKRDINDVPKHWHNTIYDAIGLALWAINNS
jgi:hypothetical protein